MATKTPVKNSLRKRATNTFGLTRIRSAWTVIACTTTLSTVSPLAPAVAQDAPAAINQLGDVLSSSNPSIAELATAIAKSQGELVSLESEIGKFRENVNRALVDLQDARTEATQAREGAVAAREELDDAEAQLQSAQERLNELSRAAYRRANTSEAVTRVSGGDARSEMLERQAYLRTQAAEQQIVVDGLERKRTEKANKESQLRQAQKLAEAREQRASEAESKARGVLEESETKIAGVIEERDALVAKQSEAQELLDQVRGIEPEAAQAPAAPAVGAEGEAAPTTGATVNGKRQSATQATEPADNDESSNKPSQTTTQVSEQVSDPVETRAVTGQAGVTSSEAELEAALELSSAVAQQAGASGVTLKLPEGSSVSDVTVNDALAFASSAAGIAASIIAASQPQHTALDTPAAAEGQNPALQGPGTASEEEHALADEISGVLEPISSIEDVTEKAQAELGDLDRSEKIEAVIARAQSQIGMPYAWGGGDANGPTKGIADGGLADSHGDYNKVGFDCSGLTLYAFAAAGISLPHYTGYQYNYGTKVPISDIQRGDLLFWGPDGGQHVAIYLGNGMMIEAPQSGQMVSEVPVRYGGMAPYAVRLL